MRNTPSNTLGKTIGKIIFVFSLSIATLASASNHNSADTQNSCPDKGIFLQVLGSGGPELDDGAASSSYAIWEHGNIRVLIDAGTGTAEHFGKTGQPFSNVEVMLFTHFHTDHSADFAAYIKNSFFEQRSKNLWIYGPTGNNFVPSTSELVQRFIGKQGVYPYLASYLTGNASYTMYPENIAPSKTPVSFKKNNLLMTSIDAEHGPFPALAWRVEISGKSITFSGDNGGHNDYLIDLAKNTDLLIAHNAIPETTAGVAKNLHMIPSRIAEIAHGAKTKKLLLSHFMKRTAHIKKQTVVDIKKYYSGKILLAKDLACYAL